MFVCRKENRGKTIVKGGGTKHSGRETKQSKRNSVAKARETKQSKRNSVAKARETKHSGRETKQSKRNSVAKARQKIKQNIS